MPALEVNPLEVALAFLAADAGVATATAGRIAPRHKFGNGWTHGSQALVVQPSGGLGSPYVADQQPYLRCEAFGETYAACYAVYQAVMGAVRNSKRQPIPVSGGYIGLLRDLVVETEPTLIHDPDVNMPVIYFFMRALVAEAAVVTP